MRREGLDLPTAIRMENIVKRYPGVLANDHITLEVRKGEIHALLGENGAGKSTLMNILFGLSRPDSGQIYVGDKPVTITSPTDAIAHGIGMVHQHFKQIPIFTVTENIMLGDRSPHEPILDFESARQRIQAISQSTGLHINPDKKVMQLCVGDQQRAEIIKALYRGANILIMDEPTSVLTPQESDELFEVLKQLVGQGHTVIFITHKLREVMEISNRVTVLRDGRQIGTLNTSDTNPVQLAKMMVGREIVLSFDKANVQTGPKVLEIQRLFTKGDRGSVALSDVSLQVHSGEILGIAGVDGNGQKELVEAIMGLRPVVTGDIRIGNKSVMNFTPRQIIDLGVSNIPFTRQTEGLVLTFSVSEDLILKEWRNQPFTRKGLFDKKAIRGATESLIQEYNIRTTGPDAKVGNMSGGNQQKVVLARELSRKPNLLIACHPTHGLDIGATEYVRQQLLKERERGAAVLLISTELDEILSLCDRIAIFFEGRVMGEVVSGQANIDEIGLMMLGVNQSSIKGEKAQEERPNAVIDPTRL
jgi:general nucleoside transport system ATP-binding protein